MNKSLKTKSIIVNAVTVILLVLSSLFMFNFYKCLSGFIANGFREPLIMIPIVSSYLLPVISFLYYFYDFYIKKTCKVSKIIYLSATLAWAITNIVLVLCNVKMYATNSRYGVYDTLYGIFIKFPYDSLLISLFLVVMQILSIVILAVPSSKLAKGKECLKQYGIFKLSIFEYLPLCVLAIIVFVFTGDTIGSFNAIENVLYDAKYIYLVLWIFIVPLGNLLSLVIKPETRVSKKSVKISILSALIGVNVIFALLLFIFEKTSPDFIVGVGKPLFLIAFSVSIPIEMMILLAIGILSSIVYLSKIVYIAVKK